MLINWLTGANHGPITSWEIDGETVETVADFIFGARADREIGVFRHVSPSTWLCLEYPRETGLILRCTGKGGNPFKTKHSRLTRGVRPHLDAGEKRGVADLLLGGKDPDAGKD